MYKGLSAPFIHRPIATTLIMVAVLLVGLVAFPSLPVAPLPQVDFPTITVSASLPGASPDTMATSVAQPLERQIAQIPGVSQMTSTSSLGATAITVQFDLNRNIDAAANDIQAAINAAAGQLPKDLPSPPTYRKVNPSDTPILILSVQSDVAPVIDVDDAAENILAQHLEPDLRRLPRARRRPADARHTHPDRSREACRKGAAARGRARADRHRDRRQPQGRAHRSEADLHHPGQRPADPWPRTGTTSSSLIATGRRCACATSARRSRGRRTRRRPPGATASRASFSSCSRFPARTSSPRSRRSRARLTTLQASIPPTIHVSILSDRTTTIRASVRDVELTLALTIVLVVMVIFVFLRSLWATIIPSVTVPLALLGACALMWVAGYSLDNLSLMAFTISVGFVVDDAIVMLENITRHIEEGEKPFQAALKGSAEIGFTIISISVSLVAVLIPLLMMSGIIGRLFREFSVTIAMTIFVSAFVSLTLTPMMASRFLKSHDQERHGRLYKLSEKGFVALANGYERGVDFVLRHRFPTLLTFIATRSSPPAICSSSFRRGSFRSRTPAFCSARPRRARTSRSTTCIACSRRSGEIVLADPAVDTMAMGLGSGVGNSAQNNGRMFITLKPREERDASAFEVIARLRPKLAQVPGMRVYLQAAQDVTVGRAFHQNAVPVHAAGRQFRGTQRLGGQDPRQAEIAAANCATSRPTSRAPARR